MHAGIPPPRTRHPSEQTPPGTGTPLGAEPPRSRPPCAVQAGRYSQQAGGMHPTGMQSFGIYVFVQVLQCFVLLSIIILLLTDQLVLKSSSKFTHVLLKVLNMFK